jgi:DNA polymerase-3 subunit epsilon/ATP-dependent DNA helicase DinG
MRSIVAIDIETTGLSPDRDVIIEIGAVKFKGHRVENEWTSLINPGRHIPEFITGLTGISDVEVRSAPRLADVVADLGTFVGDAPVVGHSVRFDLGFLQKSGLLEYNDVIDTYELASVLMPTARALCEVDGVSREASLALLDQVAIGDFVLIHAGFAIEKVDAAEAEETLRIFRRLLADGMGPE